MEASVRTRTPLRGLILGAALAVAGSGALAGAATAATVTVCKDGCDHSTIGAGIAAATAGDAVAVGPGTYAEDVIVNKAVTLTATGGPGVTTIEGPIGGEPATVRIAASNAVVEGFTITRAGNDDWNNPDLNVIGVAIQGQATTGATLRDSIVIGNRNGIDVNDSSGHFILGNDVRGNRTGLMLRNRTDDLTVANNAITDNQTVGVLFLDASLGTNVPLQQALGSTFVGNAIADNWWGQVVDRQTGGALPAPGDNPKDFRGNWLGTDQPVVSTEDSGEPPYVEGPDRPNGPVPTVLGPASGNIGFGAFLWTGTDGDPGPGFVGDASQVGVSADSLLIGASPVQEAIDGVESGGTIHLLAGEYAGNLEVDKPVAIVGAGRDATTLTPAADVAGANAWITVLDGRRLDLSDVTLDGAGRSIANGIRYRDGSTGRIERATFRNINGGRVTGIAVTTNKGGAPDPASIDLQVTGSRFENVGRIGVLFKGTDVTGAFRDNVYVGKGAGDYLDYGVEVAAGAEVEVVGNTITGNLGNASDEISAAVYVSSFHAPGSVATVKGNTLTGNMVGLYVGYQAYADDSQVSARGNRIVGNGRDGVYVAPGVSGTVDVRDNWWGCNAGPAGSGCDSVTGAATASTWTVLGASAARPTIGAFDSTPVSGDLSRNSAGAAIAGGGVPSGTSVAFSTSQWFVTPTAATADGVAQGTLSSTAQPGTATVTAELDGQRASTTVTVPYPPAPGPTPGPTPPTPPAPSPDTPPAPVAPEASRSPATPSEEQVERAGESARSTLGDKPVSRDRSFDLGGTLVFVPTAGADGRGPSARVPVIDGDTVLVNRRSARRGADQVLMALSSPIGGGEAAVEQSVRIGGRTYRLPVQELRLEEGGTERVALPLTRRMRRALAQGRKVTLTLTITVVDGQGNESKQTKTYTVESPKKAKKAKKAKKGKKGRR